MERSFTQVRFLIVCLISMLCSFQAAMGQGKSFQERVIRIKFKLSQTGLLDEMVLGRDTKGYITTKAGYAEDGVLMTGIASVDSLNSTCKAMTLRRVFSEGGRFEAAHREYGLHLWYEMTFDSSDHTTEELVALYKEDATIELAEHKPVIYWEGKGAKGRMVPTAIDRQLVKAPDGLQQQQEGMQFIPDDPLFNLQWHLNNTGQTGGTPDADVDAPEFWHVQDNLSGSRQVIVAVIDGGLDVDHEDLQQAMWVNEGEIPGNGIDDDNNGKIDDIYGFNFVDNNGTIVPDVHGTHVGGLVGAVNNNGTGVASVGGGTGGGNGLRLMTLQTFDDQEFAVSFESLEDAFVYAADNGAVVVNNSWGADERIRAIEDGINYFIERAGFDNSAENFSKNIVIGPMEGGIVVFAAGNDGNSEFDFPAALPQVTAVAATTHNDAKASYSNFGGWVDISAPGGGPDDLDNDGPAVTSTLPDDMYGDLQGTSMASPITAGSFALGILCGCWEGLSDTGPVKAADIRAALINTVDPIDEQNPSFEGLLGSGRVNIYNPVEGVQEVPVLELMPESLELLLDPTQVSSVQDTLNLANTGQEVLDYFLEISQLDGFDDRLLYDEGLEEEDNLIGFSNSASFTTATRFTAGTGGFLLTHVQTFYQTGVLSSAPVNVLIYKGGSDPGEGTLLTTQTFNRLMTVPAFNTVALDESQQFSEGETFWLVFQYPQGINFPQGANNLSEMPGTFLFAQSPDSAFADVQDIQGFETLGWKVRALSGPQWLSAQDASGTVATGITEEISVTAEASGLEAGNYRAELIVRTNAPANPQVVVPVRFFIGSNLGLIDVSPEKVVQEVNKSFGPSGDTSLLITNTGNGNLGYQLQLSLQNGFNERLFYDQDKGQADTYFGGQDPYITATRFQAPLGGFELTHVQVNYRTGELAQAKAEIQVRILRGGSTPEEGAFIGSESFVRSSPSGVYHTVALDESLRFTAGETFWVVVEYPRGIDFPQGADSVMNSPGTFFFQNSQGVFQDLQGIQDFQGFVWKVRALSGQDWLSLSTPGSPVGVQETDTLTIQADASELSEGTYVADIIILSSARNEPQVVVPVFVKVLSSENMQAAQKEYTVSLFNEETQTQRFEFTNRSGSAMNVDIVVSNERNLGQIAPVRSESVPWLMLETKRANLQNQAKSGQSLVLRPNGIVPGDYVATLFIVERQSREVQGKAYIMMRVKNRSPVALQNEVMKTVHSPGQAVSLALKEWFRDEDREPLKYRLSSGTQTMKGDTMEVSVEMQGVSTVQLEATDVAGAQAVSHLIVWNDFNRVELSALPVFQNLTIDLSSASRQLALTELPGDGLSYEVLASAPHVIKVSTGQHHLLITPLGVGESQVILKVNGRNGVEYETVFEVEVVSSPSSKVMAHALHQNFPNPMQHMSRIIYDLATEGQVLLEVCDLQGRKVKKLVEQDQKRGTYSVEIGKGQLEAGIYLYRLFVNGRKIGVRRLVVTD